MNVFELFAKLGLDSSEYDKGLEGAEKSASSFGTKLKAGLGVAAGVATTTVAATAAATTAAAKAFVSGVSDVAAYGDEIDKMSQKMNMSAEAYQEWDFIMQHAGTSISSMQMSIKTLSNAAETGSDAFEALGITQEQIAEMSGEELFASTITALQGLEDETQRTYLAGKLLGRGATELGALLNMSADEISNMKEQAHTLGGVMSDEAVKAAAGFSDSLQNVQTSLKGMKNNMLADFLPAFSTTMDGLSNIFSGVDMDAGLQQIESGIMEMADKLASKAPEVFAIGGSIIEALASSIAANLPTLLEAAVPVLGQLVTTIVGLAPTLIDSLFVLINSVLDWLVSGGGLETIINGIVTLITSLANALATNIGTIIPMVVQAILQVITTLTSPQVMVPMLQAGITLLLELIKGILSAIPMIIEQLPVIIENIVNTLMEGLPLILDAGLQIFQQLINSIPIILEALLEALPSIIETIITFILDSIPMILDACIQLLMSLIQAIPVLISSLVQNLPQIIFTIINTLLEHLPDLIMGAIQLFMGILEAIPVIIVELIKNLPQIIVTIVEGIMAGLGQIAEVGINLIKGLWEGIKSVGKWLWDKISGFFSGIFDKIKGFFGIKSPSRLFRDQIGKNLALGIGEGFEDEMGAVGEQMTDSAQTAVDAVAGALATPLADVELNGKYNMQANASGATGTGGARSMAEEINAIIDAKLSKMEFVVPVYIGGKKIDQQIVSATARAAVISGGR